MIKPKKLLEQRCTGIALKVPESYAVKVARMVLRGISRELAGIIMSLCAGSSALARFIDYKFQNMDKNNL